MKKRPAAPLRTSPALEQKETARRRFAPGPQTASKDCNTGSCSLSDIDTQLRRAVPLGHSLQGLVVQPKLTLGPVGDRYEQEADRVAREVMQHIASPAAPATAEAVAPSPHLAESGEAVREDEVQRKAVDLAEGGAIDAQLEASIHGSRSGGQGLGERVRGPMESAFQADFSSVKVHTDHRADQLNRSLQARAFTTGQDIFFRRGEYQPGSSSGKELLAHELTHVVQQTGSALRKPED